MATRLRLLLLLAPLALGACDLLGIEPLSAVQARREAEGKAVGSACRHAGRAIEDCYTLNRKADKAAVFAGWREMNDYMTENKIEVVAPSIPTPEALASKSSEEEAVVETKPAKGDKADKGDKGAKAAHSTKGG
jgi:hypothetical protein